MSAGVHFTLMYVLRKPKIKSDATGTIHVEAEINIRTAAANKAILYVTTKSVSEESWI